MEYTNIYYFREIYKIGGIETFFFELAKKYNDYDITIVYERADALQIKRLKQYVRCIRYNGETIKCKKAFFNFNLDIIDKIEADEYCLVIHGDYKMLNLAPPLHEKINKYYGVSQRACDSFTELTGIPCDLAYNPLTIEKPKPMIRLVSACRLYDPIKGGGRTQELIKKLDEYSQSHGFNYTWEIFSDTTIKDISRNVVVREPTLDILPYLASADYVVQLSDNLEAYCYTVNEALTMGVPAVITPCNVYKELKIDESMAIFLDFDLSNIDKVVENIFNKKFNVKYTAPEDNWGDIFVKSKSTYKEELKMRYKVEALEAYKQFDVIDKELKRVPKAGEVFEVTRERLDVLLGDNPDKRVYVKVIEEIKPETEEKPKKARATKKD